MEILIAFLGGGVGAGLMSIVLACLQRHWNKKDKEDTRIDALVNAQKLTMIDIVKRSAKVFIRKGKISLEDKEHIKEQYTAYKSLGGNGHLDTMMNEINRLPVVDE